MRKVWRAAPVSKVLERGNTIVVKKHLNFKNIEKSSGSEREVSTSFKETRSSLKKT